MALSSHLSLNREGRWCTTDDFATSFLHFPVLHCVLGLGELHACAFPEVVSPPLPMYALSSSPFHCTLQDVFSWLLFMKRNAIKLTNRSLSHWHSPRVTVCWKRIRDNWRSLNDPGKQELEMQIGFPAISEVCNMI